MSTSQIFLKQGEGGGGVKRRVLTTRSGKRLESSTILCKSGKNLESVPPQLSIKRPSVFWTAYDTSSWARAQIYGLCQDDKCGICNTNYTNCTVKPCDHHALCVGCAQISHVCPKCPTIPTEFVLDPQLFSSKCE